MRANMFFAKKELLRRYPHRLTYMLTLLISLLLCATNSSAAEQGSAESEKVSRFGEYSGYSERRYNSYVRKSEYIPGPDGMLLAADVYHPAIDGVKTKAILPSLLYLTIYTRATIGPQGELTTLMGIERSDSQARFLLEHGYVIVAVDVSGTGASFGRMPASTRADWLATMGEDAKTVVPWIAKQTWSSGKVGMFGSSAMGISQIAAAAEAPEALKAIFPQSHYFDAIIWSPHESQTRYNTSVALRAGRVVDAARKLKRSKKVDAILKNDHQTAPVDGPLGEALLVKALEDRAKGKGMTVKNEVTYPMAAQKGRDNPERYSNVKASNIPLYSINGMYDYDSIAPLLWFENMDAPTKAVIGPWTHGPDIKNDEIAAASHAWIVKVEALRWYDYWLKGIQNGILDEPRIQYAIEGKNNRVGSWLSENQWPSPRVKRQDFFFDIDDTQQRLSQRKPSGRQQEASYTVDYSATTGQQTRYWDGLGQGPLHYPEMGEFNSKALVYTGDVLTEDTVVAGVPVLKLRMTADAPDTMVYVYLEKVYPDGRSVYVSDGALLASWRNNLSKKAPYKNFGLPYYSGDRSRAEKAAPLTAGKVVLTIPMQPVGMQFEKGTRIRVAISGADADSFYQKPIDPAPRFTVYSGGFRASKINLPLLNDENKPTFSTWVEAP